MRVLVRADASVRIGSGHVMRCLTLADALRSAGAEVRFVCRLLTGHMADAIAARGFDVVRLPAGSGPVAAGPPHVGWLEESPDVDAAQCRSALADETPVDWLIVDHYALDAVWEGAMRSVARRVMVIDDVADRDHDCDLLLDQNLAPDPRARYASRVPEGARLLLGPRFALLRPTFRARRLTGSPATVPRTTPHLFIFLGGADPDDVTSLVLDGLALLPRGSVTADVVVGAANPHANAVRRRCEALSGFTFHRQVEAIDVLMARADLAVCSAGSITWERCALGLPAVTVAIADNQRMIGEESARAGTSVHLGDASMLSPEALVEAVTLLLADGKHLEQMSTSGRALVDGEGSLRLTVILSEEKCHLVEEIR
jgi:UDP-2,4-diacetamido-2,4,6-trideoxy-beta-L-altropyranose hydrolase